MTKDPNEIHRAVRYLLAGADMAAAAASGISLRDPNVPHQQAAAIHLIAMGVQILAGETVADAIPDDVAAVYRQRTEMIASSFRRVMEAMGEPGEKP